MKLYTADRETGTFIEEVKSVDEGKELISEYEFQDRVNDVYEDNFYDIVDENHNSVL